MAFPVFFFLGGGGRLKLSWWYNVNECMEHVGMGLC